MARGGKREGAGKPKGYKAPHTLEASAAKKRIIELVSARVDELTSKLFELAFSEKGDIGAIKELLDRAFGKPMQPIVGDDEEPPIQIDLNIGRILDGAYGANKGTDESS